MRKPGRIAAWMLILVLTAGCGLFSSSSPAPGTITPSITPTPAPVPTAPSPAPSLPSLSPTASPSPHEDEIAVQLLSMTLDEKIGQMLVAGVKGTKADDAAIRMIKEDHVGGVIMFKNNLSGGIRSSVELINGLKKANAGNQAPLFISVDQEGGRVSRLPKEFEPMPSAREVGKTGNIAHASKMSTLIARQLKLLGINMNFAPVLDINSNPKNPVIGDRAFGDSAELVKKMGWRAVSAYPSWYIVPVVKHFPGHGDTAVDSHLDLPVVRKTEEELTKMELIPFEFAVQSGVGAVMVAHILFPELDPDAPASLSGPIITGLLRGKLGFDGVVITDDLTMGAIVKNYGIADAAVRSVEAGSDILLVAHGYDTAHEVIEAVRKSVESGRIPESRIDESVTRILKLKKRYAVSDDPVRVPDPSLLPNDEIRRWKKQLSVSR